VAMFGELTALAFLLHLSTAHEPVRILLYVGLGVASAVALAYAVRSIRLLIEDPGGGHRPASVLTHRGPVAAAL
jgi:hypothetical protein